MFGRLPVDHQLHRVFGRLIVGHRIAPDTIGSQSRSQSVVAYRAARHSVQPYLKVSGGAPMRNAPSVQVTEAVGRAKAQRSRHKHRTPVRLLCGLPRCATKPECGCVPYSRSSFSIGMRYLTSARPTRHCSRPLRARDRSVFEVIRCSALAAPECQTVGPCYTVPILWLRGV